LSIASGSKRLQPKCCPCQFTAYVQPRLQTTLLNSACLTASRPGACLTLARASQRLPLTQAPSRIATCAITVFKPSRITRPKWLGSGLAHSSVLDDRMHGFGGCRVIRADDQLHGHIAARVQAHAHAHQHLRPPRYAVRACVRACSHLLQGCCGSRVCEGGGQGAECVREGYHTASAVEVCHRWVAALPADPLLIHFIALPAQETL
jgi:hypothetical protein